MANVRLKLTDDVYMILDGQPCVVLSGSIFDCVAPHNFSSQHVVTVAETPNPVTKPTSVRGVRTK
jgi:hypothetical protein